MVHYDPTLTDDHCRTSMAHHPLKDVEVHSLKRRKWRGEGGRRDGKRNFYCQLFSVTNANTNPRLAWWCVLAEMVCT